MTFSVAWKPLWKPPDGAGKLKDCNSEFWGAFENSNFLTVNGPKLALKNHFQMQNTLKISEKP